MTDAEAQAKADKYWSRPLVHAIALIARDIAEAIVEEKLGTMFLRTALRAHERNQNKV